MKVSSTQEHQFFSGGGDMGKLIRAKDWNKTPLGNARDWPQSLRTMVSVMLDNPFGMYIAWGKEYTQIYNDGYRPILGSTKHPHALGISTRDTFAEIWDIIGSMFEGVMNGVPVGFPDFMLPLNRNGFMEECYFDFSYSPIRKENGEVGGVLVTVIETTNKKKAEEGLKESKDQLQFAIESAELATWDFNPATNKFTSNNRLKEWFGLTTQDEIELHHAINAIAEKDRGRITAAIQKSLDYASGGNYKEEYSIIHPVTQKEKIVQAKGKAWFNNEKIAYRFNGTIQDVTEQVIARKKIEESEIRFRTMAENSDILIAVSDETGKAVYFNNAWAKLTGRPTQQLLNFGWADLIHEEDRQGFVDIYLKALEKQESWTGEFRILSKEGSYKWILAKAPPRFSMDGNFEGYISSSIDITERKEARVWNSTNLALAVGSTCLISSASDQPTQGITIDQPSTQRRRYRRSSIGLSLSRSSMPKVRGFLTSPSTTTAQGRVFRVWAFLAGSALSVPNS